MQELQQLEGSRGAGFLQLQGQPCRNCHRQGGRGAGGSGGLRTPCSCCLFPGNLCTTSPKLAGFASCQSKAKDSRAEPAIVPPSAFRCPLELSWGLLVFVVQLCGSFPRERHCQERLFAIQWGYGKQKPTAAPARGQGTVSQQGLLSPLGCQTLLCENQ